ncbi:MAG: hypothetical protein Rhirs2KO_37090 [Rhizobiaceae bacterium]
MGDRAAGKTGDELGNVVLGKGFAIAFFEDDFLGEEDHFDVLACLALVVRGSLRSRLTMRAYESAEFSDPSW